MATRTRPRTNERQQQQRQSQEQRQRQPQRQQRQQALNSRLASVQRVARETYAEMKKISWPDRETTRNLTLVVIAISVVLGLLLGGVDAAFARLWNLIPAL